MSELWPDVIIIMAIFYVIGFLHGRFPRFNRNGKTTEEQRTRGD